jgi:hypothetical protein
LAVSGEYSFERFDREGFTGVEQIFELDTHRLPIGVAYFHPSGATARLRVTFVNQHGLIDIAQRPVAGRDRFAVLDASIGYRLPKRYGFITLEAKNLLDEDLRFSDTDPASPSILPDRMIMLRFVLSL